ncbi:hypothetical protein [uncultured Erythrobacter sp.]|uniref:hypothetical protein n=1 Tax=uncultured Erythrobacter sp. TaxID=263913 RepID=UPI002632482E|nr:hypothetical protein [uncultured Erythrobacter sp.]
MIKLLRLLAIGALLCGFAVGGLHAYDHYKVSVLNHASKSSADDLIDGASVVVGSSSLTFRPVATDPADSVILLHAWGVPDPAAYSGLIEYLVNDGRKVHFPLYQRTFLPHSIADKVAKILDADEPSWREHARLLIGHSAGATAGLDLALQELGSSRIEDVILLSPGDGSGPDGKPAATSVKMLEWGQTELAPDPTASLPRFHIFVSKGDWHVGDFTARRIAEYLRTDIPAAPVKLHTLPDDIGGCSNHFWPLGGTEEFELPQGTQWFAAVDAKGRCGDWKTDPVDHVLHEFIGKTASARNSIQPRENGQ